jgi:hypothetical protein
MIRERDNAAYYCASIAYHLAILVAALVGAAWWRFPVAVLFALLLARACVFPRRSMTPKQVGLVEIAASVLLVVVMTALR